MLRSLAVLLILSLIIGGGLSAVGSLSAAVEGDFEYELINGGTAASITGYAGEGGDVVVPSTIAGKPVKKIANSAFEGCENIVTISLPGSLTAIGHYAFMTCRNLTSISIPENVTSMGIYVFNECGSLGSIDVDADNPSYASVDGVLYDKGVSILRQCPGGKTGVLEIPEGVTTITAWSLCYCAEITSVSMPDSVTSVESFAFFGCSALASVELSRNLTTIDAGAFSLCSDLVSVQVPEGVTTIGDWAFEHCLSLTSVSLPSGVGSLGVSSFGYCEKLTQVHIPDTVTYMGSGAFKGCTLLSEITLPEGIPAIESTLLMDCRSLVSVTIPDSVGAIYEHAFSGCTALRNITVPANVTSIGDRAFAGCSALTYITFEGDAPSTGSDWADDWNDGLSIYFLEGSAGFTVPTWNGLPCSLFPSLPGSPVDLTVAGLGNDITLTWNDPIDDGGAVIEYFVVYQDGVPVCNTTAKRATLLDLVSGETYEFKVVAHNFVGNGEMSAPVSFTAGDEAQEDDGEDGSDPTIVLVAAGAVVAIVASIAVFFVVKRRGKG
jgi:hypothetical protein